MGSCAQTNMDHNIIRSNQQKLTEEADKIAFIFSANLNQFNLESRLHMAAGVFNAIYKPLEKREGELDKLNDAGRKELMDLVTLDIMSKTFMAMEDLGKIVIASKATLGDFPYTIL